MSFKQLIEEKKYLIVCGTGGVGKTTLSATLSVGAALSGKKTLVLTMDPAKRLATALGLSTQSHPSPLDLTEKLRTHFPALPESASWHVFLPHTRASLEQWVKHLSPSPQLAQKILQNPIFEVLAKEFSGAQEYLAIQTLLHFLKDQKLDLIIVDTPPSAHLLSFLESPRRLEKLLQEKWLRWLARLSSPTQKGARLFEKALFFLHKWTGSSFMEALYQFAQAVLALQENFTREIHALEKAFQTPETAFLLVVSPEPSLPQRLESFFHTLQERKLPFGGVIYNRLLSAIPSQPQPSHPATLDFLSSRIASEQKVLSQLQQLPTLATLPELAKDIHSIEDMKYVVSFLFPHLPLSHPSG